MQAAAQTKRNRLLVGSGEVRKLRHPGLWMFTAVLVFFLAITIHELFTDERFGWDVIGRYFFSSALLKGLGATLQLTVLAMVIGICLGAVLALMRMSKFALIRSTAGVYIWVFRSVPLLVQVIIWFNISAPFPDIGLGLPFGGPTDLRVGCTALMAGFPSFPPWNSSPGCGSTRARCAHPAGGASCPRTNRPRTPLRWATICWIEAWPRSNHDGGWSRAPSDPGSQHRPVKESQFGVRTLCRLPFRGATFGVINLLLVPETTRIDP
jgi:His/Glu/Gln/Arg/opine family amino acid ABC transporter permease subunit